jgi:hypothetical protein
MAALSLGEMMATVANPNPHLDTTFSLDVLGRRICDTWDEIQATGVTQFDVVIIGSGTCGAYLAQKLYRSRDKKISILVIEQGPFFLATHCQNLGGALTGSIVAYPDFDDKKIPTMVGEKIQDRRGDVWNTPWISNTKFRGLAYCIGGRSLFWAGWSPRLTSTDLKRWPAEVRDHLLEEDGYAHVEREIGADKDTLYITETKLYRALESALEEIVASDAKSRVDHLTDFDQAPLAVLGSPPQPGLFPFDKFSSVTSLSDAICQNRDDAATQNNRDKRRLFVLPRARVLRLNMHSHRKEVSGVEFVIEGENEKRTLEIGENCIVVLANGTIEATRLALNDLGVSDTSRLGNLMAHLRSNIFARIKRSALRRFGLPYKQEKSTLEVAAFIVRGEHRELDRRFHFQFVAGAGGKEGRPDAASHIWSMVPHTDMVDVFIRDQGEEWVSLAFYIVGEIGGRRKNSSGGYDGDGTSWISNDGKPASDDRYDVNRARVHFETTKQDEELWDAMDLAALRLAWQIGGGSNDNVDYGNGKTLQQIEADFQNLKRNWRDPLGFSHHEGGTLYVGQPGDGSIADTFGKFHNIKNAYVVGPAVFPTVGSANPTLTALALTRRTAQAIIKAIHG